MLDSAQGLVSVTPFSALVVCSSLRFTTTLVDHTSHTHRLIPIIGLALGRGVICFRSVPACRPGRSTYCRDPVPTMGLEICICGGHHISSIQSTGWWFMDGEEGGDFLFHFFPFLLAFSRLAPWILFFIPPPSFHWGGFFFLPSFGTQQSRFSSFSSTGGNSRAILIVVELFGVTYYALWRNGEPRHVLWKICFP